MRKIGYEMGSIDDNIECPDVISMSGSINEGSTERDIGGRH